MFGYSTALVGAGGQALRLFGDGGGVPDCAAWQAKPAPPRWGLYPLPQRLKHSRRGRRARPPNRGEVIASCGAMKNKRRSRRLLLGGSCRRLRFARARDLGVYRGADKYLVCPKEETSRHVGGTPLWFKDGLERAGCRARSRCTNFGTRQQTTSGATGNLTMAHCGTGHDRGLPASDPRRPRRSNCSVRGEEVWLASGIPAPKLT